MDSFLKVQSQLNAVLSIGIIGENRFNGNIPSVSTIINLHRKKIMDTVVKDYKKHNKNRIKRDDINEIFLAEYERSIKKSNVQDMEMRDGSIYSGEGFEIIYQNTKFFIPDGRGSAMKSRNGKPPTRENSDIMVGYWENGVLSTAVNGKIQLMPEGTATRMGMYKSHDFTYIGMFIEGKFTGHGKMTFGAEDAIKYIEGGWEDNVINGMAAITYNDGSIYHGSVKNFKKHGIGTFWGENNFEVEGNWVNDLLCGHVNICLGSVKILCQYENGKIIGKCYIAYPSGNVYSGECDREFRPNGHGKMRYIDRTVYHGYWQSGIRQGPGFCRYPNGDYYNGYWENDKRHVRGIYYRYSGSNALDSVWEYDEFKAILRQYNY